MNSIRSRSARQSAVVAACLVMLSLTMTACGSGDDAKGTSGVNVADAVKEAPEGSFPGNKAAGTPVKLGLINPDGGQAISQPEQRLAVEGLVKYYNEELGGLGGHPIELEACKNAEDASSATSCANQMVQAGVVGVVVPATSTGDVMVPIITKAGIAYTIPTAASAAEYTTPNAFVFTSSLPGLMVARAKYAKQNDISKVTMYIQDAGTVLATIKSMAEPAFQAEGVDLNVQGIPPGTPDATPQVAAGLKFDPGAVDIIGDGTTCTSTIKALDSIGNRVPRWFGQTCLDSSVIKAVGVAALEDSSVFTTTDAVTDDPDARLYRAIMAKYAPKADPLGAAQFGYQAGLSFLRAAAGIKGDVTAASVLTAIKAARDVPLGLGHGATMTCSGKLVPGLPDICGVGALVGKVKNAKIADVELIK